ncbi:MAG: PD40 domain-containing protein [Bacteroidia bacterium]|nr:PD40 domain-containing protein [Bacteroidia bacterium]
MKRVFNILLSLVFILAFTFSSFSQAEILGDADSNFEDENYEVALKQYLKIIKKYKDDPKVNYRVGYCYLKTNYNKGKALPYLLFADSVKGSSFESIQFDLAQAYFYRHNFENATSFAKKYLSLKTRNSQELAALDRFMEMCSNAKTLVAKPLKVTFVNLGDNINSPQDDFIPFITEDETFMVFSSARKYNNEYQQFIRGVYLSSKSGGAWQKAKAASAKINTDENAEAVGINKDGSLILAHVDRLSAPNEIYFSQKNKAGSYSELADIGNNINSKYGEAGASISQTGDTMFFASDRPGGKGGFDIYYAIKLPDQTWGIPVNLGEPVNTENDENYPNITAEGTTLYFSSTGHNSMGGYDVFRSRLIENKWAEPKNLGYPINDTYDNYNIALTSNARYGYISKFEEDGLGGLDIYRVIFNDIPQTNIIYTGRIMVGDSLTAVPFNKVDSILTINVYNKDKNNAVFATYQPSKTGKYTIALPPGSWKLEIVGKAYLPYSKDILIRDEQPLQVLVLRNIYLKKK